MYICIHIYIYIIIIIIIIIIVIIIRCTADPWGLLRVCTSCRGISLEGSWDVVSKVGITVDGARSNYICLVSISATLVANSQDPLSRGSCRVEQYPENT